MADNRSSSSGEDEHNNAAVSKKGAGRPRKCFDAMSKRTLYRRLKEQEQFIGGCSSSELFQAGQSDEVVLPEVLDPNVSLVQHDCEIVDTCDDLVVDETGEATIPEGLDFQWVEGLEFDAQHIEDVDDQSMPYLNLTFEELMALEEPISDEDEGWDLDCDDPAAESEYSSLQNLERKLAIWRSSHNITRTAMTALLHILADHSPVEDFSKLPRDSRTITSHTSFVNTEGFQTVFNCAGGTYVHLGVEEQSCRILTQVEEPVKEVIYEFSTDGLGLWNSSPSSVWPWLARIVSVPPIKNLVFLIACWFGERSKPTSGNIFTAKLVEELILLMQNGIIVNGEHKAVFLRCIVADAPAKCLILEIVYFNGYSSCTRCHVYGSWNGRTYYPLWQCKTAQPRIHTDYVTAADPKHHVDIPKLAQLPGFDIVKQVPLDPMHLLYRGIAKTLLGLWTAGERPYVLSAGQCASISSRLEECRQFTPSDFQRKPRALTHLPFFKATEYRLITLYIGPACFKDGLDNQRYNNYLCFHVAIRILADPHLCKQEAFLSYAEKLLLLFLQQFRKLYDEKFLTHNFHGVYPHHLVDDVRRLGPLESFSSFPYDNFLRLIKDKVRKGDQALQQLVNRYIEDSVLAIKQASAVSSAPQPEGLHQNGPLLSSCSCPQYKTVRFKNFQISTKKESDSICFLKGKEVVAVANVCWCAELECTVIVGRQFLQPKDFFDVPCKSSLINIFRVSQSKVSSLKVWAITDIVCKMMAVPYQSDFIMYPLLHCEI